MSWDGRPEKITLEDVTYYAPDDPLYDIGLLTGDLLPAASKGQQGVGDLLARTTPLWQDMHASICRLFALRGRDSATSGKVSCPTFHALCLEHVVPLSFTLPVWLCSWRMTCL